MPSGLEAVGALPAFCGVTLSIMAPPSDGPLMAPSVWLLPLKPSCSPLSRPSLAPKYIARPWVAIWSSFDCDPVSGVKVFGPIGWVLAQFLSAGAWSGIGIEFSGMAAVAGQY